MEKNAEGDMLLLRFLYVSEKRHGNRNNRPLSFLKNYIFQDWSQKHKGVDAEWSGAVTGNDCYAGSNPVHPSTASLIDLAISFHRVVQLNSWLFLPPRLRSFLSDLFTLSG